MDSFCIKLKELRIEKGLTQKAMAEQLNISIPTLSHWECDYQEPAFKDLIMLSAFFSVTVDELLGISEGGTVSTVASMGESYTREERQLIEDFRQLNHYKQELIKNNIKAMLPAEAESEQKKNNS